MYLTQYYTQTYFILTAQNPGFDYPQLGVLTTQNPGF